uniref:Uncharacterized protein n=1 Tax=Anguilla anguilla TaxID=7936 RepID=A0A0E9QAS3_ANGAN
MPCSTGKNTTHVLSTTIRIISGATLASFCAILKNFKYGGHPGKQVWKEPCFEVRASLGVITAAYIRWMLF